MPVVIGMQPRARCGLVKLHQLFALFIAPQRRRQCADIHGEGRDIQQMVQNTRDFVEHRANPPRAHRRLDAEQLFRRQHPGVLHAHRGHIIEPIEIRRVLRIGPALDQLFSAAMQQPHMRVRALHDFAVHFQHQTQHAMRRRMLRTEIDRLPIAATRRPSIYAQHQFLGRRRCVVHTAPPRATCAFSSPGSVVTPSHGDMKEKFRKSCVSFTGS